MVELSFTLQLNDPVFEVRGNAHQAIEMTSQEFPGGRGVLASGLVPVLVERLKTEEDEIKVRLPSRVSEVYFLVYIVIWFVSFICRCRSFCDCSC